MSNIVICRNFKVAQRIHTGLNYEGVITTPICIENPDQESISKLAFNSSLLVFIAILDEDFELLKEEFFVNKYLVLINNCKREIPKNTFYNSMYLLPLDYRKLANEIRNNRYISRKSVSDLITYRTIEIDEDNWQAKIEGRNIKLRNKEFILLKFFVENNNRVLTRINIIESVWDVNANSFTNTVDVHVGKLRKILNQFESTKGILQTITCVGYILK